MSLHEQRLSERNDDLSILTQGLTSVLKTKYGRLSFI